MARVRTRFAHLDRYFDRPEATERLSDLIARMGMGDGGILGLTASRPGEGVTTLVLYLARHLHDTYGAPVLVLESNFRQPSVAEYCRVPATPGLAQLLLNKEDALDAGLQNHGGTKLFILTAGGIHRNPLGLVSSSGFVDLLDAARGRFRFIVCDVAPPPGHAETGEVLRRMDRRILVVRAISTRRDTIRANLESLKEQGVHFDAAVLNRTPVLFG